MTNDRSHDTAYNGLARVHQPRPWRCTQRSAIYCPIHHDCTCVGISTAFSSSAPCPLHGPDTNHGTAEVLVA